MKSLFTTALQERMAKLKSRGTQIACVTCALSENPRYHEDDVSMGSVTVAEKIHNQVTLPSRKIYYNCSMIFVTFVVVYIYMCVCVYLRLPIRLMCPCVQLTLSVYLFVYMHTLYIYIYIYVYRCASTH